MYHEHKREGKMKALSVCKAGYRRDRRHTQKKRHVRISDVNHRK